MLFISIPYDIQTVVKNESLLTGKSVRQVVLEKLRRESVEKSFSPELIKNLTKLEEIKSLKHNWNGNKARPISKKIINKTKTLLVKLDRQPQIFPTADDSIQLEYDGENNSYLELQVKSDDKLSYFRIDKNGQKSSGVIPESSFSLEALVREFYE